jgi:hypothetical protein
METIFDYNITEEEKKKIGCPALDINEYLRFADSELMILDLAYLFHTRGDMEKAKSYADKLPPLRRQDWYRTINHY